MSPNGSPLALHVRLERRLLPDLADDLELVDHALLVDRVGRGSSARSSADPCPSGDLAWIEPRDSGRSWHGLQAMPGSLSSRRPWYWLRYSRSIEAAITWIWMSG